MVRPCGRGGRPSSSYCALEVSCFSLVSSRDQCVQLSRPTEHVPRRDVSAKGKKRNKDKLKKKENPISLSEFPTLVVAGRGVPAEAGIVSR